MALAIFTLMVSACKQEEKPQIKLSVSPTELKIKVGEVGNIKAKVTPSGTALVFTSSNDAIASVNEKGEVKGLTEGSTTIIVRAGKETKKVSILVYKPETDYSARMIGNKDNKLTPPFYIPLRALMKERFEDIKAANQPFGWRYINDLIGKKPDEFGYYFAPVTKDGEDFIDNRYIEIIQYDYANEHQAHIELFTNIREDQNPFSTEPGKKIIKEFAEGYGFTTNGQFNDSKGKIGYTYTALNGKLGKNEQLSIIVYAQPTKKGKYRVLANILYHYHKDH